MDTDVRLLRLSDSAKNGRVKIMIIGLGSVGNYLLGYLLSTCDEHIEVIVAGRDEAKMQSDVNIAVVGSLIRRQCRCGVRAVGDVDLESVESIAACLAQEDPDIIVNTSRVFAGLKYGSISWSNVRAYGIWAPLAVRYIRNIMAAHELVKCHAVVINTSYSDGTIPWLRGAGHPYPDFGSGNLNHIAPRLKLAAADMAGIEDFWNIEVHIATAHFHDVVISKEGHDEGLRQFIKIAYGGKLLDLNYEQLLKRCAIPMPVDQKRNMMNASSNFEIIECLLAAARTGTVERFCSPGAFGEIGGYPVMVDGRNGSLHASIDTSVFSLDEMREKNRASIALDGIESIEGGVLEYTDDLVKKAEAAFGATLPKRIRLAEADEAADFIIDRIIKPQLGC